MMRQVSSFPFRKFFLAISQCKFFDQNSSPDELLNNYINQGWKPVYRELIREARPLWNDLALKLWNELFGFIKFE